MSQSMANAYGLQMNTVVEQTGKILQQYSDLLLMAVDDWEIVDYYIHAAEVLVPCEQLVLSYTESWSQEARIGSAW